MHDPTSIENLCFASTSDWTFSFIPNLICEFLHVMFSSAPLFPSMFNRTWLGVFRVLALKELLQQSVPEVKRLDETSSETLRVALICGGPSAERGISLNSARSVLDHLQVGSSFRAFFFFLVTPALKFSDPKFGSCVRQAMCW